MLDMSVIGQLREWIAVEEEIILNVSRMKMKRSAVAGLLLYELVADTSKHINILNAIIDLIEGCETDSAQVEFSYETIKDHLEKERRALEFAERLADETEDEHMRLLLSHIMDDERRHHDILTYIGEHFLQSARD